MDNKVHPGRPEKNTVDYFQHDCLPKGTLKILESKWRNDGYAFWYKLLETLGMSDGHYLNLNEKAKIILLSSKMLLDNKTCTEILDTLSELDAIDPDLWEHKIIWCDNFVKRISHLYVKRINGKSPAKPDENMIGKLVDLGKKGKIVSGVGK